MLSLFYETKEITQLIGDGKRAMITFLDLAKATTVKYEGYRLWDCTRVHGGSAAEAQTADR